MSTLRPIDIALPPGGALTGTLGKYAPEVAATVILWWHHQHSPEAWVGLSMKRIAEDIGSDDFPDRWKRNPIWVRGFGVGLRGLTDGGWVEGWMEPDVTSPGKVTAAFLAALEGSPWDRRQP